MYGLGYWSGLASGSGFRLILGLHVMARFRIRVRVRVRESLSFRVMVFVRVWFGVI